MNRIAGYIRVSTEDQATKGISLSAQRDAIETYCKLHQLDLVDVVVDSGISAATLSKRPGILGLLDRLRGGDVEGLVVLRLDRLSRSTRDVLELVARSEREAWKLHSIHEKLDTSTPAGRFVVTIMAALSQMEREQIGARTREALGYLRTQGKRTSGKPPFGYRFARGHEVEVKREQAVLEEILALRAEGNGALRVANALNARGLVNPRTGKPWTRGSVQSILSTAERRSA